MATFLTGATGFLGRYVLDALLDQGNTVYALVRARNHDRAERRLANALGHRGGLPDELRARLKPVPGRLTYENMRLSDEDRDEILEHCDDFIHCAASVRFNLPLEQASRVNVEGTTRVLDLARERLQRGPVKRFDFVSTCYVAGRRTDIAREDELEHGAGFRNSYEESKYRAEQQVRSAADALPICVHRPSIVVGESTSGKTSAFHSMYVAVRVYAQGLWRILPANPACPVDIVPVDFVRDAMMAIRASEDSIGKCYHIAAGQENEATIKQLSAVVQDFFPLRKRIIYANPARWGRLVEIIMRRLGRSKRFRPLNGAADLLPYFTANPIFDTTETRKVLASAGITAPDVSSYLETVLRYAVDSDFGTKSDA